MRRLTVECPDGHLEEIVIGIHDHIPICKVMVERTKPLSKSQVKRYEAQSIEANVSVYVGPCRRRREIVWGVEKNDGHVSKVAPSFRVQGATKKF